MKIPQKFDEIRPWEPEELPAAYSRLTASESFRQLVSVLYPGVSIEEFSKKLESCTTNLQFQIMFCYPFIGDLMNRQARGYEMDSTCLDPQRNYTFISNHRDIVLDSALLDKFLVDAGFSTTCEIAIGDNLIKQPWLKDLVRVNKAFVVERDLPMREMLMASKRLSEYMHFAVGVKHENIWIAQREGRAKDSDDRTQEAVLKMMALGGEGSLIDRLTDLHLVPLSISYEYDPCDFLKAREFQQRRDMEGWKKGPDDDLVSMKTGIFGFKGHVHYHAAPCLDDFLKTLDPSMPKAELFQTIATTIDREIHGHYRLYPCNYIALDEFEGSDVYSSHYTPEEKQHFDVYLNAQLGKIDLPDKDDVFLRECMLTMYANPARNYLTARS